MLREKRAIELVQLPIRHVRFCTIVGAAQTRARQNRGHVQSLDDGQEYLLACAIEVLHINVLFDHGACHRGCLVQVIGASTVVVIMTLAVVSGAPSDMDHAEPPTL